MVTSEVPLEAQRGATVGIPLVRRLQGAPGGASLIALGIALVVIGTMVLDRSPGLPRWVLAIVGLVVGVRGIDMMCKAWFGPTFDTGFWLALGWVGAVALAAVLAPLLPIQGPRFLPLSTPSYIRPDLFSAHPLGTDGFGRDYLDRLIWGARVSLLVGVGCTAIGLVVGTTLGMLAAYYKGWVDRLVRLIIDSLLAFPPLVFLLALVAVLRPSVQTLFIAFSVLTIPTIVRLARASASRLSQREYVVAARAIGSGGRRIMVKEILPGVMRVLLPYSMVIVAALIVAEASLSFLGLGVQQPNPSWGNMIAGSENVLQQDPQGIIVPAAILLLTVVAFNRLGERARQRTDTRQSVLG